MQIPLIKISMEVFREWKSSKLGIEMGLRNRILIHQTCQEWSNPVAIQRQLQTIYMILDNPLYSISRISSPFCWVTVWGSFGAPGFPLAKWEQLCHAKFAAWELSAEHLADAPAPGMLTIGINLWGEFLKWIYLILLFSCWSSLPLTVAALVPRKGDLLKHVEGLPVKVGSTAFSARPYFQF